MELLTPARALLWLLPQPHKGAPTQPVVVLVIALIAFALVGFLLVMLFRRQLLSKDNAAADQGTVMESIRAMRNAGQISSEEYDAMRQRMIASIRSGTPPKNQPAPAARPTMKPAPLPSLPPGPETPGVVARPGFDLTGAPLPKPRHSPPAGPPAGPE